jgi:hypothetical protein
MSFLYKRADSPYWYAGINVNGRWVRRSLGVSSRKAAAVKTREIGQALALLERTRGECEENRPVTRPHAN